MEMDGSRNSPQQAWAAGQDEVTSAPAAPAATLLSKLGKREARAAEAAQSQLFLLTLHRVS